MLGDIRTEIDSFGPDVVVDLIVSSERQAVELVARLGDRTKRFVVASSQDVYRACGVLHGTEPGGLQPLPLTEESELRTAPAYPPALVEKLRAVFSWVDDDYDKVRVEEALRRSGADVTILRLPMIYGPSDRLHRFRSWIKVMAEGQSSLSLPRKLADWRGPKGYVDDVARAFVLAVLHDEARGRIYNVVEPDSLTELEWAELLAEVMGWRGEIHLDDEAPVPGNYAQHWVASSERIRAELGFREAIDRRTALARTVEWELANAQGIA